MLKIANKISFQTLVSNIFFAFIVLTMIFTRSLMGFKLFGFRLGELIVGFGIVLRKQKKGYISKFKKSAKLFKKLNKTPEFKLNNIYFLLSLIKKVLFLK